MNKLYSVLAQSIASLLLIGGAIAAARYFIFTKPETPQAERPEYTPLVRVKTLHEHERYPLPISTFGTARERHIHRISSEVNGPIREFDRELQVGRRIKAGQIIAKLDSIHYESNLVQQDAQIAEIKSQLALEEAESERALREWKAIAARDQAIPALVAREPQIAALKERLRAAKKQRTLAQVNLERCTITSPINGIIKSVNLGLGRDVQSNQTLLEIIDEAAVDIHVAISGPELLALPALDNDAIPVTVRPRGLVGQKIKWDGFIEDLVPEIDRQSQLPALRVSVNKPFDKNPPLLPGVAVEVIIYAQPLENVFIIPRRAADENSCWVVDENNTLQQRQFSIATDLRLTDEEGNDVIAVRDGLKSGDVICLDIPAYAREGMPVQTLTIDKNSDTEQENNTNITEEVAP